MLQQRVMIIVLSLLCLAVQNVADLDRINTSAIVFESNRIDNLWRECNLTWDEAPAYGYFMNAYQRHYNHTTEDFAAYIIADYSLGAGIENEEWELKQIYHYKDGIYQAYAESDMKSELYILFTMDTRDARPEYIITADIRKTGDETISFWNGEYSYNSMLEWYSYEKLFSGEIDMKEHIDVDITGDLYDSIYGNCSYYAICDYIGRFNENKDITWEIDENTSYVGRNGEIASMSCIVGTEKINLLIDVWNKTYAVIG